MRHVSSLVQRCQKRSNEGQKNAPKRDEIEQHRIRINRTLAARRPACCTREEDAFENGGKGCVQQLIQWRTEVELPISPKRALIYGEIPSSK